MPTRILLVENIHPVAKERLEEEGFDVTLLAHSPSEKELLTLLQDFQILGIRSKTEITAKVLKENSHLLGIGCFCIGTNQVDLAAASRFGVPVFNAPHSNTRSVAELVIAEMIALSRQLFDRSRLAHEGDWIKSADGSREVRGKTLGIIGYGHIGSQVSILAESMGMRVLFYDIVKKLPLGNAKAVSNLTDLLKNSDFITLHVPETKETKDMIGKREIAKMKKGSVLLNASRGSVVVIEDLVEALESKQISGCAIDVFPKEPASNKEKFKSPLQGMENVILTPHIGGSTEEAQYAIGLEVAESFKRFLNLGATGGAVNFPQIEPQRPNPDGPKVRRIYNVHRNEPGVLGEINSIVSEEGANIQAQYLSTDENIGFLLMDVEEINAKMLVKKIALLERSIKTRLVF
jgi:D-3-phosphoglycerate dehydrogenase